MKITQLTIVCAIAVAWVGHPATAQQVKQPVSVNPVAFEYNYYEDEVASEESPSDKIVPPDMAQPADPPQAPAAPTAGCGDYGCGLDGCASRCGAGLSGCRPSFGRRLMARSACMCSGDPWELSSGDNCWDIDVGGWFQFGYHTEGRYNTPTSPFPPDGTSLFNNRPNQVQLQQGWLYVEKAVDNGGCGWDFGGRFDYVYGTDGPNTQAFGNPGNEWDNGAGGTGIGGADPAYGHAVPQAYLQVAYNDLTITAGKFFTVVGYEVVAAPGNFFYSHAFTQNNAEPFTHSGVLAEYAFTENITLWGGWTAGWDTGFVQNANGSVFLGGFALQLTDRLSFAYVTTMGNFGGVSDDDGYSHSMVLDWALSDRWEVVLQSDYIENDLFLGSPDDVFGVNSYLFYYLNDCVAFGQRLEWYSDPRQPDEVLAYTAGVNIKPHANVIMRPEVRWQRYASITDEFLFGMDVIFTY